MIEYTYIKTKNEKYIYRMIDGSITTSQPPPTMANSGYTFSDITVKLIPYAWFYMLRDMGRCVCRCRGRKRTGDKGKDKGSKTATDCRNRTPHLESGRASNYVPSRSAYVVHDSGGLLREAADTSKMRSFRRDVNIDIESDNYLPVLPPIVTKSRAKLKQPDPTSSSSNSRRRRRRMRRRFSVEINQRLRNRVNYSSPKIHVAPREVLARSIVVVKTAVDPQSEFRDSMVEMIVENKITSDTDLEELLACYLSLNSNEFHDMIVKVFRQIWFRINR